MLNLSFASAFTLDKFLHFTVLERATRNCIHKKIDFFKFKAFADDKFSKVMGFALKVAI